MAGRMAERVCILTAGKGSRLNERTRFFNKALLRVGDKAVISHQIDMFPADTVFVIGLGYMGDIVRQYLEIAHPDTHFIFVEIDKYSVPGAGPGYALNQCRQHLQQPFYFLACDTLVSDFSFKEEKTLRFTRGDSTYFFKSSWIGYDEIPDGTQENYCIIEREVVPFVMPQVVALHDKKRCESTEAFIGFAYIYQWEWFWDEMRKNRDLIRGEIQLSPALDRLCLDAKKFTWFDIGTETGLLKARHVYDGLQNLDKPDEELYICDGKVIKYFFDQKIVSNRVLRAKHIGAVPALKNVSKNFYSYDFIDGKDLFHLAKPEKELPALLEFAHKTLWQPRECDMERFRAACDKFYREKTHERLKRFYAQTRIVDQEEIINNIATEKLSDYLAKVDWIGLTDTAIPANIHGDFQLSNVVINPKKEFTFIDWRQDFAGLTDVGDIYYDFAKLNACFMMPHDSVKKGLYSYLNCKAEVTVSIEVTKSISDCSDIFFAYLRRNAFDVQKVKLLTYLAMLNMAPLHEPPLDRWLYYTAKHGLSGFLGRKHGSL